ncbi:deoxyguanosinetriphosphate triphosphohydrolase family protein [Acetobacterium woodii]|uniref:Deoxyguanosinetriphosphate triphosphohydrolase Dgt n=1 Tax=Acetobacterium woodii (strain ATCC 29683 / DSM 1030 / JCM 2381 / KCTC 1655 / WB1) TaxID=931626 RepID=H6LBT1_ACEWD|nr:dNTP triphosphohydrolase [Acetobacterium woodii]AFA47674.1 deoxyguanosinetriphosphate triphosphohydrolase Dgt [Acetobacterium woodii DSM 1030]
MEKKIVIIKCDNSIEESIKILTRAQESYDKKLHRFYNTNTDDKAKIQIVYNAQLIIVFVSYSKDAANMCEDIEKLYLAEGRTNGEKSTEKDCYNLRFKTKKITTSKLVINNFVSNTELDLERDFDKSAYMSISHSKNLIKQLEFIMKESCSSIENKEKNDYVDKYSSYNLDSLAQHNSDCIRLYGKLYDSDGRSEFQHDRERIVNSKSFRRLVDKAQIFTSSKGDHYRTRITHTLEVSQISKAIAIKLNLNVDLTEAIALAHDLGHTPFGHQGERTLDRILKNKIKIINIPTDMKFHNEFGGFKHNFQGIRVLTCFEEKYAEYFGLDVSLQVLDGVLKHTKVNIKNCKSCDEQNKMQCEQNCYELSEFYPKDLNTHFNKDIFKSKIPFTLEGQVVKLADEIAQRGHDIDDTFTSGLIGIDEFSDYMNISFMKELKKIIDLSNEQIDQTNRFIIDENDLRCKRIISDIVGFFINDVVDTSLANMKEYKNGLCENKSKMKKFLVTFSDNGERANEYLEKIISRKGINSLEVSKFDYNAEKVIIALFKAYYENPKLLHKSTLKRIYYDIKCHSNIFVSDNIIDFINGDHLLVKTELDAIAHKEIESNELNVTNTEAYAYWEKRKILVRNITDYISSMTDSYALNEYNSIKA